MNTRKYLFLLATLLGTTGVLQAQKIPDDAAAMMAQAMTMQEVDEETETGFRRTAAYSGYKALEEYDEAGKTGKVQIYTGDRVAVEIESHGVSFAVVKQVIAKVDLKKLAGLKAAAPAAVEAK